MNHFNGLTPAQAERLAILSEELGEAVQAVGKILRHGYRSSDPTLRSGPNNRENLEKELADVRAAMIMLSNAGDIGMHEIINKMVDKMAHIKLWMHHDDQVSG